MNGTILKSIEVTGDLDLVTLMQIVGCTCQGRSLIICGFGVENGVATIDFQQMQGIAIGFVGIDGTINYLYKNITDIFQFLSERGFTYKAHFAYPVARPPVVFHASTN